MGIVERTGGYSTSAGVSRADSLGVVSARQCSEARRDEQQPGDDQDYSEDEPPRKISGAKNHLRDSEQYEEQPESNGGLRFLSFKHWHGSLLWVTWPPVNQVHPQRLSCPFRRHGDERGNQLAVTVSIRDGLSDRTWPVLGANCHCASPHAAEVQHGGGFATLLGMGVKSTDDSLWQRSLNGDSDAFGSLFIEHRDRVYRHAYRLTSAVQDAEDVTATAFLELWRRRESVRTVNGSVLAWLLVTATNTARNVTRKTARHDQLLRTLPRTEPAPGADRQHEDASLVASLDPALLATVRSLPPHDLTLLTLVTYEGLTVAEAAAELGLTETGARTRLHRARVRLRRHPSLNPTLTAAAASNIEGTTP